MPNDLALLHKQAERAQAAADARDALACRLVADGYTLRAVADALGTNHVRVWRLLRAHGMTQPNPTQGEQS